ncbi:MAG: hypothetical protein H6733_08835 [Alphaproteobacteria bacterium]|nr:hypothetical protein [Alphaproteobacteria bacterium]
MLVALSAWFWVQSQTTDTGTVRVGLAYRVPDELVSVPPLLNSANVIVQGPRALIRRAQGERPRIVVDVRDAGVGRHAIRLDAIDIDGMPGGLTVVAYSPEVVEVSLDERTRRMVPVAPARVGRPAEAHAVSVTRVVPDVVEVSGPREIVDALTQISSMPFDISGWSESRAVPVALDLPRGVETVEPWNGEAEVVITSLTREQTIQDVPVVLTDFAYEPAPGSERLTIKVVGPSDVLLGMRLDHVIAKVELPRDADADHYTATYDADRPPRYEIIVPDPEEVTVADPPPAVELVRR